ncbi:MAG: hypothetical protein ABIG89_06150 [Candidatus Woesearchaeota archaeon]
MDKEQIKKKIFITSFILTVIIFTIGLLLSYVLDFYRVDEITRVIETHELDKSAYFLEQEFMGSIGGDKCSVMNERFFDLKHDIHKVGIALNNYWGRSMIKTIDFDYLKRHYFLLELEFFALINKLNQECDTDYITVMFFYEKDDQNSITQGYILEDISLSYRTNVVVLSIDKDYEDEPLVPLLVKRHNITKAPVMIINDIKIDRFTYGTEINATIKEIIRNSSTDKYAKYFDHDSLFKSIGINKTEYINESLSILNKINNINNSNSFVKADLMFMIGRLADDVDMICNSLKYFDEAALETDDEELKGMIYETISSIGCGRNKEAFLRLASESWKKAGNMKRADIDLALADNKPLNIEFDISELYESVKSKISRPYNKNRLVFGRSITEIDNNDIIVSQVDRVTRDWLGKQFDTPKSDNLLTVFSERLKYNETELREDIGWHEGGRIKELKQTGVSNQLATGTIVIEKNGRWYAPNENGVFMFEVPEDKILYPTTRFLRKDIGIIVDTHGINMLVEQSMRNNASVVIGCCDHPGKIKAALYLSEKGKDVICFPDKYAYLALGKDSLIFASPPVKIINVSDNISNEIDKDNKEGKKAYIKIKAIIGNQPISISFNEAIIVTNATDQPYALWYYQTPASYFIQLSELLPKSISLNLTYITIDDFNQMDKIIDAAIKNNAHVIAARVFNSDDYDKLKSWLMRTKDNRAILFHSVPYPYGYLIMKEFAEQVTFGDINHVFE